MSRSRARRGADAALRKLYDSLPRLECKGLCHDSCGPIAMSDLEVKHMEEHRGGPLPQSMPDGETCVQAITCPLLRDNRCSVYRARPLLCRLWGLVDDEHMRCPSGCRPTRYLSCQEGHALLRKAEQISRRYFEEEGK
jgi:hypothetical protein